LCSASPRPASLFYRPLHSASLPTDCSPTRPTYTDFKKIETVSEGIKEYELTYGVNDQRIKSNYFENDSRKLTHYYLGDYEEEIDEVVIFERFIILVAVLYSYRTMEHSFRVPFN